MKGQGLPGPTIIEVFASPALLAAGLVVALVYLAWVTGPTSALRSGLKTLPLVLFTIAAWRTGAPAPLILALALSAAGDLALSRPGERAFLAGLVAFALAHIAYVALFWGLSQAPPWAAFSRAPVAALAMLGLAGSTELWLAPHTGALRWPVRAYVAVIAVMGLAALGLGDPAILIGAGLFVASDVILALVIFRMRPGTARTHLASRLLWGLYIGGQFLILAGAIS